jgi:ankyrin repeat protein
MDIVQASRQGYVDTVRQLLDDGVCPDRTNQCGSTGLIWASCNGHIDVVRLLLEHGADPDIQSNSGDTALIYACCCAHTRIAKLLLGYGADPYIENNNGKTAYIYTENEDIRDMLRRPYGRSMFQLKDRSRHYMSSLYHDIDICMNT